MKTTETPEPVQGALVGILEEEASPISAMSKEIEQKYLFVTGPDCLNYYEILDQKIRETFEGKYCSIVNFDGTDFYFNHQKGEELFSIRLRTGRPVKNRLGLKIKRGDHQVRDEIEINLHPDTNHEKTLRFLRAFSKIGDSYHEMQIHVKGDIRYFPVSGDDLNKKMEVVVFVGTNLLTGDQVLVTEIEAHGFSDVDEAKAKISEYETLLDWAQCRTDKSMTQLLSLNLQ